MLPLMPRCRLRAAAAYAADAFFASAAAMRARIGDADFIFDALLAVFAAVIFRCAIFGRFIADSFRRLR